MSAILKILVLGKNEKDIDFIRKILQEAALKYEIKSADSKETYLQILQEFGPDIILSNCRVNHFDAEEAITINNKIKSTIPFLILFDKADEACKEKIINLGAVHFLMKDNLTSLPHTIESSIQNATLYPLQQKLKDCEDKYLTLLERSTDGISIFDTNGNFTEVNESFCRLVGFSKKELLQMHVLDVIPDKEVFEKPPRLTELKAGINVIYERNLKRKDGSTVIVEINSKITKNGSFIAFIRDLTDRKLDNELLQKSQARNEALINSIPDLIFVFDRSGVFKDFHAPKGTGTYAPPEFFLGRNCKEVLPETLATQTLQNITTVLKGEGLPVYQYQLEGPEGILDFEARYAALNENEVLSIVRDITLQKRTEQKLLKEKTVSESLINTFPGVFYLCNMEGKFFLWNKNWERVTGYSGEEIKKMRSREFFTRDDKYLLTEKTRNVIHKGEDTMNANFLLKSGKTIPYFFTGQRIEYQNENCIMGVGIDISELTLAQEELQKSEEKFRSLVEQASDGICLADEEYKFVEVNTRFCEMLGYTLEEMLQLKMTDLMASKNQATPLKFKEIKEGKSILTERYLKRKDGDILPVEISATYIQDKYFLSFVRDISERRKTEKILTSQREIMEMIAKSAPIADILNTIILNLESICDNILCSIQLLSKDKKQLLHGAAPNLPETFNKQVSGIYIGQEAGPVCKAAFLGKRVIVPDIAHDPLFAKYCESALLHGLKACWSSPIFGNGNTVLGTFTVYTRHVHQPSDEELSMVTRAINIAGIALDRQNKEIELKESEEKFRNVVERISDAFVAFDNKWEYTYINKKAEEIPVFKNRFTTLKNDINKFPANANLNFFNALNKTMKEQKQTSFLEYFPNLNKWYESNLYPSKEGLSVFLKDITKQKSTELKLVKNSRFYYFISQFNQMIVYSRNNISLYREACKIAVNIGHFKMAWVGIINEKSHDLEPLVFDGNEQGYLTSIKVKADQSEPEGRGPSGLSVSFGKSVICNDIETDPKMALWKEEALKRNFLSNIALPIKKFGKVIGVFTLYTDTKNFFDEEEILLLEGATRNISFALEVFEKEELQRKAEEQLIISHKRFQNLVENISGVYWVNNLDTRQTIYISPSYEKIWGRKCEEIYNDPSAFINAVHPQDLAVLRKAYENISVSPVSQISYRIIRPDGEIRWISAKTNVVVDKNGVKTEYGYAEDITDKKIIENELAESENRLKTILQNEPESVKLLDKEGILLDMNPAGLAMVETDDLEKIKGKNIIGIINEPYREQYKKLISNVFRGSREKMVFEITGLKGTPRWLETHAVPLKNADGKIISLLAVTRDITEQKIAEENEKQSNQKLLKGAEIANFGFYEWDLITNEVSLSKQVKDIYGITNDEEDLATFIQGKVYPEDLSLVNDNLNDALVEKKDYNVDHRIICPGGEIKWINSRAEIIWDASGNPVRLFGTVIDITDNKKTELQIKNYNEQLRLLTSHLQNIREEERTRIGREIHDELGQQLTAIKMDVAWIQKNTSDKKEVIENKLKNIIALLDGSNISVRKILSELRPAILDKNGLPEAMRWHIKQFTASTNIPVSFSIPEKDFELPEEIATCIFRVFQESLTNIMRYANTKNVSISLQLNENTIHLEMKDFGIGFDPNSIKNKNTFGLIGMRERVRSLNGQFKLNTTLGKGTTISVDLPYKS